MKKLALLFALFALTSVHAATITGAKWGNIGNATDGGVATSVNRGNYNNLTFNFGETDAICTTGIGGAGVVKIKTVTLAAADTNPAMPANITLTQGETSITTTSIAPGGTLTVYGEGGTVVATRTAYVCTFSEDTLFDTSENIVLSSTANMRMSVMQPANTLFQNGGWSPIIEITGDYTPNGSMEIELQHQYSFNGTMEATSGQPLTFQGSAGDSYVESGHGQAYKISSSACPYGTGILQCGEDCWTISTFAKLVSTEKAVVWSSGRHSDNTGYVALITGTNGQVQVVKSVSSTAMAAQTLITSSVVVEDRADKYHLYTITRNNNFLKLYVDGNLAGVYSGAVQLPDARFQLGRVRGSLDNTGLVEGNDICIDEWRLYQGELSADEVATLTAEFPVWPQGVTIPETMSLNFIGGSSNKSYPDGMSITDQETAGVVEVAGRDWNQIINQGGTVINTNNVPLKEVLKNGSTVSGVMTANVQAKCTWNALGNSTPVSGNGRMMYGYLDDGETSGGYGALVTINNIPYSEYTVYIYMGSDASTSGSQYFRQVAVNGTDYPTSAYSWTVKYWGEPRQAQERNDTALTLSESYNYIKVTGLTSPTLSIQGATSYSYYNYWYFRCGIAGIQIVNTGVRQATGGAYVADITSTPANWNNGEGTGLTKRGGDWENDNTAAITLTNLTDDATLTFDTAVTAAKVCVIQAADKELTLKATKAMTVGAYDVTKSAGKVSFDSSMLGSAIALSGNTAKIIPGGTVDFDLGENGTMSVSGNGAVNNANIHYTLSSGMLAITGGGSTGPFNKSSFTATGETSILKLSVTDATGYGSMTNPAFTFEDGATLQVCTRDTLTTPIALKNGKVQMMPGCANSGRGLDLFNSNGNYWTIEGDSDFTFDSTTGEAGKRVYLRQGDWNVEVAQDSHFDVDVIIYGDKSLIKTGAGDLYLNGQNEYTGSTTISEGTVYAGNPSALGTGAVTIEDGGKLVFDLADFSTVTEETAPFNFADEASKARVEAIADPNHPEITYDPTLGKVVIDRSLYGLTGLRILSVNPKPKGFDANGHESSVVKLTNYGPDPVNLKDYKLVRTNYGKKVKATNDDIMPLLEYEIAVGETYAVYLSEDYETASDLGGDGKTVKMFGDLMVVPTKINPKKYPMVRLYDAAGSVVHDEVIVPCEIDDGITVETGLNTNKVVRYVVNGTTRTEIGPEVNGPYGTKDLKNDIELMNDRGFVVTTNDYTIILPVNPLKTGDTVLEPNKIKSVRLEYRFFDKTSMTSTFTDMTKLAKGDTGYDKNYGTQWKATIPQSVLEGKEGKLLQYRAIVTDNGDAEWTAPRFCHPELGYQWYGAIVQPSETTRTEKLPTMLMFADSVNLVQMDKDVDKQDKTQVPYNARIAIYDTSTHSYYDNVRIDLRGNTSANFKKKSHGLRFSKVAPFTTTNPLDGKKWEVRKSSFCTEYADPTYIRQSLSFWLLNKVDSPAPFHYPVRLYLNGEFYQLAFHTERFTDELIEDVYGLNKFVYSYKNIGTFGGSTSAGGIEKKTPDDDNESDLTVLNAYMNRYKSASSKVVTSMSEKEKAALTKNVVTNFDLSAWINYMAIAKITHENDDVWANLSGYINKYDALHNPNGNDLMSPLAYDMNLSWGQWYYGDDSSAGRCGVRPADDQFKSHPFYGGMTIRAHKVSGSEVGNGNRAYEAVWQNEKFRRLYLRRLRTLMDDWLKEPGTPKEETPFWTQYVEPFKALIDGQDVTDDRTKWDYAHVTSSAGAIWVWDHALTIEEGYEDLWENYIEPRREHLYGKHSITNNAIETGYNKDLKAGIPEAQSPIADLKAKINYALVDGGIKITNANDETVDISGWTLGGPFIATVPNGTVLDETNGEVYFVTNRIAYCNANAATLTDEFIIGNIAAGTEGSDVTLKTAKGEDVIAPKVVNPQQALRVVEIYGSTNTKIDPNGDTGEFIVITNTTNKAIDLEGLNFKSVKDDGESSPKVNIMLTTGSIAAYGSVKICQNDWSSAGWTKITNGAVRNHLTDSSGAVIQESSFEFTGVADGDGASMLAKNLDNPCTAWEPGPIHDIPTPPPPAPETTVITGVVSVATSYDGEAYIISNATLNAKLSFTNPAGVTLTLADATTGDKAGVIYSEGPLTIKGDGTLSLSGETELMNVGGLTINGGTLNLTAERAKKIRTVVMRGNYYQNAGTVTLKVTGNTAEKNALGFSWENCTDAVYTATLEGTAVFNATMTSPKKSDAFRSEASGVAFTIGDGAKVTANFSGVAGELIETDADITIKGGAKVNVTSTATGGKVLEAEGKITVKKATIDITATGADTEAFSAGDTISIENKSAVLRIKSTDDCFNAQTNILVSAGTIYGHSISNDVFDSNGAMTISGGTIVAYTLAEGHEAFDTEPATADEQSHTFTITGGTIVGLGGKNAAWPTDSVFEQETATMADLDPATYSEKYLVVDGVVETLYAKLPKIDDDFIVLATVKGLTDDPTVDATCPVETPIAKDIPAWRKLKNNQQFLRFAEIYGNTAEDASGDVGEYFVLTNISENVVYLKDLEIEITKEGTSTKKSKCHFTVTNDVMVAARASYMFKQSVWGWEKITNGDLTLKLTDADGKTVQSGETSNDFYPECDGNGASLIAKTFEKTIAMTTDDWEPSFRWFYFTIADNAATITGFGTTKLAETTLALPRELGKVPVTLVDEGAFADCALTTLKVTLTNETLKVMATEGVSIAQYDMSESEGELVLGYALSGALDVSGSVVVGPSTATLAFDLGDGVTQEVKGTTTDATKLYGLTVKSGILNFGTTSGGATSFRDRVVTADGENAIVRVTVKDATGYSNPAVKIVAKNGGQIQIGKRDTLIAPIELDNGTVKLMAGCADSSRGLDLYNGSGNNWTVSGTSYLATDPGIAGGDGRKVFLRNGDWNIGVAEDSLFTVEATLITSGASGDGTRGNIVKTGAGTLYLAATDSTYTTETIVNGGTLKLAQDELKGALTMAADTALDLHFDGTPTHGTVVLTAASLNLADNVAITVDGVLYVIAKTETTLTVQNAIAEVEGKQYGTIIEAAKAAGDGGVMTLLKPYDDLKAEIDAAAITLTPGEGENVYTIKFNWAVGTSLIISEIMPKPSDKPDEIIGQAGYDKNGLESGWVELLNTANAWVDLKDYKFIRVNRSKANSKGDYGNFPSALISPNERYVFWTSERYANSASMADSAFETPVDEGKPHFFPEYNMMVWPDKVNPKKFAFVRFSYYPEGGTEQIIDTVVIPSDIPEGYSIIIEPIEEEEATVRYLCAAPTQGTENPSVEGLDKLGPNIGPLYEIKDGKKHDSANEFGAVPPAKTTEAYTIPFSLNPTMSPTESAKFRDMDAITGIKLVYRFGVEGTPQTNEVALTHTTDAKDQGDQYTAEIPAEDLAALNPGTLIQWKFLITDAASNEWTSPSFHNLDDGYEWYGTITEPGNLNSANLPTWHMFVDSESLKEMDKDADDQTLPYNARAAIYDASTSNYYDYVRIDLRGNTSKSFSKKSHGLRFAKAHPLTMRDIVSGKDIEEIRKTSLISEVGDPTYLRQLTAFWLLNKVGSLAPFDFPVRVNRNGEFYQMAFNSERFTDELIEDVYVLDKYGYSYKNVGTLKSGSGTTAGGIEKKTPDDGNESDISVLQNELRSKIKAAQQVGGTSSAQLNGTDKTGLGNAELTKFVVQKFNLPAWLNYLAITKITQECDDVWANISVYYDNAEMKEGTRGTDTWMPLAYDMNLSIGQWHAADLSSSQRKGLMSTNDWFKSHPFYGGNRVRCWSDASYTSVKNSGNDGVESVWQNAKFRRLYLRRLRTLMDQELKAPGTPEEEVPFMVEMRKIAKVIAEDAVTDRQKYPAASANIGAINVWPTFPAGVDAGLEDIWNNYVVPRREHFYITHAAEGHDASEIGYASKLCAGIPAAQSPIVDLKAGFTATFDEASGMVAIQNANDEVVDMSGWILSGPMAMTLPMGTVVDANDSVYIVADRRAYVAAIEEEITDQVIVGNATLGADPTAAVLLSAADGTPVIAPETKSEQEKYLRLWGFCGAPDGESMDANEFIIFTNLNQTAALDVSGAEFQTEKNGAVAEDRCHFFIANGTTIPAGGWLRINQADIPWKKITDGKVDIWLKDSKGVLIYQLYADQGTIGGEGVKGNGYFAVYDNEAETWSRMLIADAPGGGEPPVPPEPVKDLVFTGSYPEGATVALTNDTTVIISNATFGAALTFTSNFVATIQVPADTASTLPKISAVEASLVFEGTGTTTISNNVKLIDCAGITVKSGTLNLELFGDMSDTMVAAEMAGSYLQQGGTVNLRMNCTNTKTKKKSLYGFRWKDKKDCTITIEKGGVFNAELYNDSNSVAFKANDPSNAVLFDKAVITGNFTGVDGRMVDTKGTLMLKGGTTVDIVNETSGTSVFKADGLLALKKATVKVNATGVGSKVFSSEDSIEAGHDNLVLYLVSQDRCFNATTNIVFTKGVVYAQSTAGNVFSTNATLKVTGGTIVALGGTDSILPNVGDIQQTAYTNLACTAEEYSDKYLIIKSESAELDVTTTAQMPTLANAFSMFVTTANMTGEPTASTDEPAGTQVAKDVPLWIEQTAKTFQENLRFYEIYGKTNDGIEGDTGEYFVLTNVSDKTVLLSGLKINIGKKKDCDKSGPDAAKVKLVLSEGEVEPFGSVTFLQKDYTESGWEKITNGDLYLLIRDVADAQVQKGYTSNELYPQCNGGGASLIAKTFGKTIESSKDDWRPSFEAIIPGEDAPTYQSEKEAQAAAEETVVVRPNADVEKVITAEDYNKLFSVVPVDNGDGTWTIVAQLNETVAASEQEKADNAQVEIAATAATTPAAEVQTQAGLYYGIAGAESLDAVEEAVGTGWVLGDGTKKTVTIDKVGTTKGFYQMRVSASPSNLD